MNRHVLIINRWTNSFAEYHRYLDHTADRVAYLTTAAGRPPLDEELAEDIRVLSDLSDTAEVLAQTTQLVEQYGPFTHVLALSEFDLEPAGEIRRHFGIPGRGPEEVAAVRDKVVMKGLVAAAACGCPPSRRRPRPVWCGSSPHGTAIRSSSSRARAPTARACTWCAPRHSWTPC